MREPSCAILYFDLHSNEVTTNAQPWTSAKALITVRLTRLSGSVVLFELVRLRIPTGFQHSAQGCDAGATLGTRPTNPQPQRGCIISRRTIEETPSVGILIHYM